MIKDACKCDNKGQSVATSIKKIFSLPGRNINTNWEIVAKPISQAVKNKLQKPSTTDAGFFNQKMKIYLRYQLSKIPVFKTLNMTIFKKLKLKF